MMAAWPFLAFGVLLLALVLLLLRRTAPSRMDTQQSLDEEAHEAAPHLRPFPLHLGDRLFGLEDWEFVVRQKSPELKRQFLQYRTALALAWLRAARANATALVRAHSKASRKNSRLEPLIELGVIGDYLALQGLYWIITALIWLRGPVALKRLVGYAAGFAEHLHETVPTEFATQFASVIAPGGPSSSPTRGAGADLAR